MHRAAILLRERDSLLPKVADHCRVHLKMAISVSTKPAAGPFRDADGEVRNHVCATYTVCARRLIRGVTGEDLIVIAEPKYAELDFRISIVQMLTDIGFIFMRPAPL